MQHRPPAPPARPAPVADASSATAAAPSTPRNGATATTTAGTPRIPVPRNPPLSFDDLPRHWFADNAFATALANGVNLLFPAGERFFVRSVHHFLDRLDDETLRAQVRGFSRQEGHHARHHEDVFRRLEAQGFDVRGFLDFYDRVAWGLIEPRFAPELRLATTAALEHFTALLAEDALVSGNLDLAHPSMRDLLSWHAAEEIEHRAVAFDVLKAVDPRYRVRIAGLALATAGLALFWTAGTSALLWQDRSVGVRRLVRDWWFVRNRRARRSVFVRGIRAYLRPDFHPLDAPTDALADEYLARAGLT